MASSDSDSDWETDEEDGEEDAVTKSAQDDPKSPGVSTFLSPERDSITSKLGNNGVHPNLNVSCVSGSGESSQSSVSGSGDSAETAIFVPGQQGKEPKGYQPNGSSNLAPSAAAHVPLEAFPEPYVDNEQDVPLQLNSSPVSPLFFTGYPQYPNEDQLQAPLPQPPYYPPATRLPSHFIPLSDTPSESDSTPHKDNSSDFNADGDWGDTFDDLDEDPANDSGEGFSRQSSVIRLSGSRPSIPSSSDSSFSEPPPPVSQISSLNSSRICQNNNSDGEEPKSAFSTFKSSGDIKTPQISLVESIPVRAFYPAQSHKPNGKQKARTSVTTPQGMGNQIQANKTNSTFDPTASLKGVCCSPSSKIHNSLNQGILNKGYIEAESNPKSDSNTAQHPVANQPSPVRIPSGSSSQHSSILMSPDPLNRSRSQRSVTFANSMTQESSFDLDHSSMNNSISRSHSLLNFADVSAAKRTFYKHLFAYNLAFFLLFSAFIGLAVVQSSLNGRVGAISLTVLFLVTIFSCIFISPIANTLIGCKSTILICFGGFMVWEVANFYPHYGTMIPAGVICGAAYGSVWAAQATHFTELSINYAEVIQDRVDAVIARSFGLFFCFLLLGTSFGCLLTSFFLSYDLEPDPTNMPPVSDVGPMPQCGPHFCPREKGTPSEAFSFTDIIMKNTQYFIPANTLLSRKGHIDGYQVVDILEIFEGNSTYFGLNMKSPSKPHQTSVSTEIYLMVGIHVLCTAVAIVVIIVFIDSMPKVKYVDSSTQQAKRSITATLKQLKRKRQLLMTPLNVYAGMSKSLMLGEIAQAYIGCALGLEMIGYASATYGVCACIAALGSGYLMRRTGRRPLFIGGLTIAIGMIIFLLLWTPDSRHVGIFFVIPALWAFPDGLYVSQINSFSGFMFQDNSSSAFAVFRFWEGIGLVIGYVFNAFICVKIKLYCMLVLLIIGTIGYFITEKVQTGLEKTHKHVTLTFIDLNTGIPQRSLNPGSDGLFNPLTNMRRQYRDGMGGSQNGSAFNISGMFESSI